MASVRKLKPADPKSPWIVEYTDAAGKRRRKTPKTGLKKDADNIARRIERELEDGAHTPARETVTVRELCREFQRHMEERQQDGAIGRVYFESIKGSIKLTIVPVLGVFKLIDLNQARVRLLVDDMRSKGRAPKTIKLRLDLMSSMMDFAIKRGYASVNPVTAVLKDRHGIQSKPIRTFTKEQVANLLRAVEERGHRARKEAVAHRRAVITVAAFCGLRMGEIMALRPENVDFAAGVIRVRESMTVHHERKAPKTRAGVRDVPMPSQVAAVLRDWMTTHYVAGKDLPLLHGDRGRKWGRAGFHRRWQVLLDRAGIAPDPVEGYHHFHALRHFAGSLMIESGYSVVEVSNILGHKHFDVTLQIYVHTLASGSRRVEAAQRMADDFMGEFSPKAPLTIEACAI